MNTAERNLRDTKSQSRIPITATEHGYFNNATIALPLDEVFEACKNSENLKQVLTDLPKGIKNFLDLTLISASQVPSGDFEIKWENKPQSNLKGTLTFAMKKAPANRGTILSAFAVFDKLKTHDEAPSDFMNVFLKRMKSLIETGEIPTTKGQPSGREEISSTKEHTLH